MQSYIYKESEMEERIYNPSYFKIADLKDKCGIYQIRNLLDGKIYIGSSKTLYKRLRRHLNNLRKNKHDNQHLQNAFNKYGEANFIFEIIEFCNLSEQFEVEQYWINRFFGEDCYNENPEAVKPPDCTGLKHTFTEDHRKNMSIAAKESYRNNPERILQMSLARIGKNMGADHVNSKAVVCFETGLTYGSVSEAERAVGSDVNISGCCRGAAKTAGGFHWAFKEDYDKMSEADKQHILLQTKGGVTVVCLETGKIYKRAVDAAADTGADRNNIVDCCNNLMKTSNGLHWAFYEDYIKMSRKEIEDKLKITTYKKCICLETGEIFNTAYEAERKMKLPKGKVSAVCRGERNVTGGYHFTYV